VSTLSPSGGARSLTFVPSSIRLWWSLHDCTNRRTQQRFPSRLLELTEYSIERGPLYLWQCNKVEIFAPDPAVVNCEKKKRYIQLTPKDVLFDSWDGSVSYGSQIYKHRMVGGLFASPKVVIGFVLKHNLCFDNCYSHVACCLNRMQYGGRSDWNMFSLGTWIFFMGRYTKYSNYFRIT